MTSDLSYGSQASGRNINDKANTSGKTGKGLKRLALITGIILAAELIWLFVISPFIPFSTIEVHGFDGLDRAAILNVAGITDTSSFMSTNIKAVQDKISRIVLVESARAEKRFPDKLSIYTVPRQAAAASLTYIGSKQHLLYVDRNGIFFKIGDADQIFSGLPVISGIDNPQINMKLPAALVPLVNNLFEIAGEAPELLAAISEIRIEQKALDGYDLVLFPVHSSVRVRVESSLTKEVIRYMLLMLNVIEAGSNRPQEIDFRSALGSYRIKEPLVW